MMAVNKEQHKTYFYILLELKPAKNLGVTYMQGTMQ